MVDEDEVENLALALRNELVTRGYRLAVRLEIAEDCPIPIVRTLLQNFGLQENAVYRINGPVNLSRVSQVYDMVLRPELKYPRSIHARCVTVITFSRSLPRGCVVVPPLRCFYRSP